MSYSTDDFFRLGAAAQAYIKKVLGEPPKKSKYGAEKTTVDGIRFDSRREARRYAELKMLQRAGKISDLRLQVPFELIPAQKKRDGKTERSCVYRADFVYCADGATVVEDAKGKRTPEYIIKRKLMLEKYGIEVKEV